jgi:hypothetical protein
MFLHFFKEEIKEKKLMKKNLVHRVGMISLFAMLVLFLAACGGGGGGSATEEATTDDAAIEEAEPA